MWLVVHCGAVACLGRAFSMGLTFDALPQRVIAAVLWAFAVVLTGAALFELARKRTTVHPHHAPRRLVTTGVFRYSRNPIYLADVLVLTGVVLWCDAVLSLPLLAVFVWVLIRRFIIPEEARLAQSFPDDWPNYTTKTRRWV